jgi:predicted nucleotidyltransferase
VRSPVADLLADLARAFDALGVAWYLFGAQAAIVYGVARMTADVDVTVQAPAGMSTADWLKVIEHHGFEARFADPAFVAATRVLPLVHRATQLPVDVVVAGPGLEDEFMTRAVRREVDGVVVPVVDVSDLVILKVLAARPKDEEDVTMLVRIHADSLDDARIRNVLGALQDALGQSDLLPAFARAVARAAR